MAIIYSYPLNFDILDTDIVIGTSTKIVGGKKKNFTKNFTMLDISGYIASNLDIQAPNLQEVTTTGNITALDIFVNGLTIGRGSGSISSNTTVGDNALKRNLVGNSNTAIGFYSLFNNTNGSNNTANGKNALFNNTTGNNNTASGVGTLYSNTTGGNNTASGVNSLFNNTTGLQNTANGVNSLYSNTIGGNNTANGVSSLYSNTIGVSNTASGANSLYSNTTGNSNTATGVGTLISNTTGNNNTASGASALISNTTGISNTATGVGTLYSNTTGGNNTASGLDSLKFNRTGNQNTAIGQSALINNVSGSNNVAIGDSSLTISNGNFNIGIGSAIVVANASDTNSIIIGSVLTGLGSNTTVIGTAATTLTRLRGEVQGGSFVKDGGTSSQFLMADGSVSTGGATPILQQVTEVGDTTNIGIKVIGLEKYISVASQDNETGAVTISTDAIGLPYIQLGLTANENTATFRADNINTNSVYQLPNSSGTMALTSDVNNRLVVERTTGYTLTNADSGGIIIFKTTAAQTLNIPLGLDAGFECTFVTLAGITLTVPNVVGITLNNATGTTMAGGLSFTLKRMLATDTFIVTGNL